MIPILGAVKNFSEETLILIRQLGSDYVHFNRPPIPGDDIWSEEGCLWLRDYCAKFGLKIAGIENLPVEWFGKIMLGQPGRDELIEKYIQILKNLGKAGIGYLGHGFAPNFVWRTSVGDPGRGGALSMSYHKGEEANGNALVYNDILGDARPTVEEYWDNYAYFLQAVLPYAESSGVHLMVHPSDPPLREVNGVKRIFVSIEDFLKGFELSNNSEYWGVNLCLGCFSQLGGQEEVLRAIRIFGEKKRIFNVHFRDVQGCGEDFRECFLDEGNCDPALVLKALRDVGYQGFIMDDHSPKLINDNKWGALGRANSFGYLKGMLQMLELLERK